MVEDLQTLASVEAAGLHLERRPLALSRVAAEALVSLASRFRNAGVHLEQNLLNLDRGPHGGTRFTVRVLLAATPTSSPSRR
jgi:hypothetical protein